MGCRASPSPGEDFFPCPRWTCFLSGSVPFRLQSLHLPRQGLGCPSVAVKFPAHLSSLERCLPASSSTYWVLQRWTVSLVAVRPGGGHFWTTRNPSQLLYGHPKRRSYSIYSGLWRLVLTWIVAMEYCLLNGMEEGRVSCLHEKKSNLCLIPLNCQQQFKWSSRLLQSISRHLQWHLFQDFSGVLWEPRH